MARNKGKQDTKADRKLSETKGKLEDDVNELYKLPLAEFTAARNALAKLLKQGGRGNEADFVKTLVKPSISPWAVNQLYWNHRDAFDRLIATGERVRRAQTSSSARKAADMREALDARRESLSHVSDLANELLREAGHSPTLDTMRRVTATLEAMSLYAFIPGGPRPGRLTEDVDPPGFESLASLMPGGIGITERRREPAPKARSQESARGATSAQRKAESVARVRELEATRQSKIAAAKASLQEAKGLLIKARALSQSLETAQKKANAEVTAAEKEARVAEERFAIARAASEKAVRNARSIADEVKQAVTAVDDAKCNVEKASKELEKLFRE